MVKISKTTGQGKHAGPAEESVPKSNPRRKKSTRQQPDERAAAAGHDAANVPTNHSHQKRRSRDWRYCDTIDPQDRGGDDERLPEPWELSEEHEAETQPQPAESKSSIPRSVVARQGDQYSPVITDDEEEENERFIETGEHIDEYDDRDLEVVERLSFGKDREQQPDDRPMRMRDFMRLLRKDGGVFMPWRVREIVNTGDSAIILGQIMYWFDGAKVNGKTRASIWRYNRPWIFKTHVELGRETGIKPRQVGACLKFLQRKGFIKRRYHRANGFRTTYITLYPEKVYQAMQEKEQERRRIPGAT